MSLYADYLREISTDDIIELADGFATYRYLNDHKTVYIIDIYVRPLSRSDGVGRELADRVIALAKGHGATELLGTVRPTMPNATENLRLYLKYGFELMSAGQDAIILRKDI